MGTVLFHSVNEHSGDPHRGVPCFHIGRGIVKRLRGLPQPIRRNCASAVKKRGGATPR